MKVNNVLQTIGNTPHIRINRLFGAGHHVFIKSERSAAMRWSWVSKSTLDSHKRLP